MSEITSAGALLSAPLSLQGRPLVQKAAFALFTSWILAASSWISVPLGPVPMTMQTYAVLLIGALCGARLGFATVMLFLIQGAAFLPVFAGGNAGLPYMAGPTGGFLFGFLLSVLAAGYAADRGWMLSLPKAVLALLVAHLLVFLPGVSWLAQVMGGDWDKAITFGWTPFVPGTVLKTALAVASVIGVHQVLRHRSGAK